MKHNYLTVMLVSLASIVSCSDASNANNVKKNERYYQTKMCKQLKGKIEHVLFDKTRVDCLTSEYAIEVDWAKKWAEGIGQALYYAQVTGKKPGVALIASTSTQDQRYLKRLKKVADKFNIKIIVIAKE